MISSVQHPLVKHFVKLRHNRSYREDKNSVLIEGEKIIKEVCSHHPAKILLVTDEGLVPQSILFEELIIINEAIAKKISGLSFTEGFFAEIPMPKPASLNDIKWLLVCDGINDPGNLGTLLRSGLALGWEGAFILDNCCDPYNDKALRAAKGATFRLPLSFGSWKELHEMTKRNQLKPLVADMHGIPIYQIKEKEGFLLVLNNEAHGISDEANDFCTKVTIPMSGEMESLNVAVAGGILMFALRQQI